MPATEQALKKKAVALSIAGADSSAGAGIQADLKTFEAMDVHGLTVVASVIAERPGKVVAAVAMDPELVRQQLEVLLESYPIAACKTGVLGDTRTLKVISRILPWDLPLVVDPVAVASTGAVLVDGDYGPELREFIRARATLVTPNLAEAEALLGRPIDSPGGAAQMLHESLDCAVLLTGGHDPGNSAQCLDWLAMGEGVERIEGPRVAGGESIHGTGCTLSAAITAGLAKGNSIPDAVRSARRYIERAIRGAVDFPGVLDPPPKALEHFSS